MFRKLPFVLFIAIIMIACIHHWIPLPIKAHLYALSLFLKGGIIFILPVLIFSMLFKTAVSLSKTSSKILLVVFLGVSISNFISTMLSYTVGSLAYQFDMALAFPEEARLLVPAWTVNFPVIVGNDMAMLFGVGLGFIGARMKKIEAVIKPIDSLVSYLLKGILKALPLFIIGFLLKMFHEGTAVQIIGNYAWIFGLVTFSLMVYLATVYLLSGVTFWRHIANMLPGAFTAFSSMSSAAAMPMTILGVEKNTRHRDFARSIVPATVNIHLVGDCFAIPIFAFAVLNTFGMPAPSFSAYVVFACYFVLAKFSVAAVPGGGILVMLPILESVLGFTGPMLSLITALYILFDPVITGANVLGNGGFAMVMDRIYTIRNSKLGSGNAKAFEIQRS